MPNRVNWGLAASAWGKITVDADGNDVYGTPTMFLGNRQVNFDPAGDLIKVFAKDARNLPYEVPSLLLVRYVFGNYGGIASAIAVMMIIMCFFFAILINWLFKERNPYGKK